tara:strand:+ start:1113 stop:1253 length:141 start_codon:yes stop_codon:yes gene_type:complete
MTEQELRECAALLLLLREEDPVGVAEVLCGMEEEDAEAVCQMMEAA